MGRRTGVSALLEWSLAFALLALVVVSALTIGAFLIPVAVAAFVVAGFRNRAWPYLPFGMCIGVGALVTVVGLMHVAENRCPTPGRLVGSDVLAPGARAVVRSGCTSLDARRWLAVGGIFGLVGLAGYVMSTREHHVKQTS